MAGQNGYMDADALKAACLDLTGAEETFPFGMETSVFKVCGKMFALSALDETPLSVSLKCEPELAVQLREHLEASLHRHHSAGDAPPNPAVG